MPTPLFVRSARVLWRSTPGAVLLLHVDRGEVEHLTGTGVALWDALCEPIDLAGISNRLAQLFGAQADTVRVDVQSVLRQLVDQQLVQEVVGR